MIVPKYLGSSGSKSRLDTMLLSPEPPFHNPDIVETRGRPNKLSGADVREADHLLEEADLGLDAKKRGWIGLVWELDLDIHPKTLQRTMRDAMTYGGHLAATKEELPQRTKDDRWPGQLLCYPCGRTLETGKTYAEVMNFTRDSALKGNGMRGRFDNIQHTYKPTDTQAIGKLHAWAAVGWEFKTPLIFYTVRDPQGANTNKAYIEQILEVEVKK